MGDDDALLEAALRECATEPIHRPGAIQPFGALLAVEGDRIRHASVNVAELVGEPPGAVLGRPLGEVVPELAELSAWPPQVTHHAVLSREGRAIDVFVHELAGVRFVELVPVPTALPKDAYALVADIASLTERLDRDDPTFFDDVARAVRRSTGYARVMIYQFDARHNGTVIAEAREEGLAPFLGHVYPASDIPPQARELYVRNRARVLVDVAADPVALVGDERTASLDLSLAKLRAFSPVHREYLKNMQVRATLVTSIIVRDRLWGLVACHHGSPRCPTACDVETTNVLTRLAGAYVAHGVNRARERGRVAGATFLRELRDRLLSETAPVGELLTEAGLELAAAVRADGVAVAWEGLRVAGEAPPREVIEGITARMREGGERLFATDCLGSVDPAWADLPVAGVLGLRLPSVRDRVILWFRRERTRVVTWAGDPRKGLTVTEEGARLSPRASFEAWLREERGMAEPWSDEELFIVDEVVRRSLAEVTAEHDEVTRRRAEAQIETLARAIEAATQGVVIADASLPDLPICYVSPGFERLTGYSARELLGRNCRILQGRDTSPDAVAALREAVRDARPCHVTLLNYRKDGSPFWNELSISPVRDRDGRLTHFIGVQTDASERRVLEERLQRSQKMQALGQLAGGVAHDFNNLLTVIQGHVDFLLEQPRDALQRDELVAIRDAGERAAAVTRQLLSFARKGVVDPTLVDVNEAVSRLDAMVRRSLGEKVSLELRLGDGLAPTRIDPNELQQALLNLVVNARDAMPAGGTVTIETRAVLVAATDAARWSGAPPGAYTAIAVADTGHGMTPEVRARIFELFFTTKPTGQGTGLGLATVYAIVERARGVVHVDSTPGVGTRMTLLLPAAAESVARPVASAERAAASQGKERILLVEDEDAVRDVVRRTLTRRGYTVIAMASSQELVTVLPRLDRVDLLITDIVMPGPGGRRVAELVTARWPGVPVLFMSGHTEDIVLREGIERAGAHLLQKPFGMADLERRVRDVLDEAREERDRGPTS